MTLTLGCWLTARWMADTADEGPRVRLDWLGVATGVSTSSILSFPSVERVVGIELLPGVTRLRA